MKKLLTLSVLILMLTGCSNHLILKHDESDGPADYESIGKILGCMFAPEKCKEFSKEETKETFDEKSDKEWNEIE